MSFHAQILLLKDDKMNEIKKIFDEFHKWNISIHY